MIFFFDFVTWLLVILVCCISYWYLTIPKNLPPGPIGLPVIGNLHQVLRGSKLYKTLENWALQYGSIYKYYIGNQLVLVLADYDAVLEALSKQGDSFSGRVPRLTLFKKNQPVHGLVLSDGHLWKEQRRFALSTLRDFGLGKSILEPRIKAELDCLIKEFSKYENGISFDPQTYLSLATCNVISFLVYGRRFEYSDHTFREKLLNIAERVSRTGVNALSPFNLFAPLAALVFLSPGKHRAVRDSKAFHEFLNEEARRIMATFDPNEEPTNYIHAFMKAAIEQKENPYFFEDQLLVSLQNLFIAGTETTSTTLRWALLHLAYEQQLQQKIYEELRQCIGSDTCVSMADRPNLPLLEATIMETQRIANVAPLSVLHRTTSKATLAGYDIPQDTVVVPLLSAVLFDPKTFPDPDKFDPYRFLDAGGKLVRENKLIPFSAGKRVCLGESLARMELLLFLSGLLRRFRFYFPPDQAQPSTEADYRVVCAPKPYLLCVEKRSE